MRQEGGHSAMLLRSFLTGDPVDAIGGVQNSYLSYQSQVSETYKKYNGRASWGVQQLRAVIDIRSAFISKEGMSISVDSKQHQIWFNNFLINSRLNG